MSFHPVVELPVRVDVEPGRLLESRRHPRLVAPEGVVRDVRADLPEGLGRMDVVHQEDLVVLVPRPPQEAHLGVEVLAEVLVLDVPPPLARRETEGRVERPVRRREPGRRRPRPPCRQRPRLPQPQLSIHRVGPVVVAGSAPVAVDEGGADPRPVRQFARHAGDRVGVRALDAIDPVGPDMQHPDVESGRAPRHAGAPGDRDLPPVGDADAAAEEQIRPPAPDREEPRVLEEKGTLLREEQAEAREVDLLVVHLHLREVRVVRRVERHAPRELELRLAAELVILVERRLPARVVPRR